LPFACRIAVVSICIGNGGADINLANDTETESDNGNDTDTDSMNLSLLVPGVQVAEFVGRISGHAGKSKR